MDMQTICKEYSIKDTAFENKIKNIKISLKNVVEYERKEFNGTQIINEGNDMFTNEKEQDDDEENVIKAQFNKKNVFKLE